MPRVERLPFGPGVLVAGGVRSKAGACLASCELYDPNSGEWRPTGSMCTARVLHQMVRLQNGKVLVAGGKAVNGALEEKRREILPEWSAEIFDPDTGTWTPTGYMAFGRADFQMLLLSDGRVLAAGGVLASKESVACELFDPTTGSWALTGAMSTPRPGFRMVQLRNGKVLAAGGAASGNVTELFNPEDGVWRATGPAVKENLTSFEMVMLWDGSVLACGDQYIIFDDNSPTGNDESPPSDNELAENVLLETQISPKLVATAMLYDPKSGTWSQENAPALARSSFQMLLLPRYRVMAAGGLAGSMWFQGNARPTNSVEVYSIRDWSAKPALAAAREGFSMLLLADGAVMAAGGFSEEAPFGSAVATAELMDTGPHGEDEWAATGSMSLGRARFQMVQL